MSYSDPINVINNSGITVTTAKDFYGLKTEDLNKKGIPRANELQKREEQRIKEAGQKTLDRWNAIKTLTDPNNEYGLVVTSLVRSGSTDHSQGMAIDISTTKAPKYLFHYFTKELVPFLLQIKSFQSVRSYEVDWKKCQRHGIYKLFLSMHNYHFHLSTNPNRGNALGFEIWNGKDKSLSSSYNIIPYTYENALKAAEWYSVDVDTESKKSFLGSISIFSLFAFIILILSFVYGYRKRIGGKKRSGKSYIFNWYM